MGYDHLNDDEFNVVIQNMEFVPPRIQSIFGLMLLAGLRVGEVCSLRPGDLFCGPSGVTGISVRNGHCRADHLRYIQCHPRLSRYLADFMGSDAYKPHLTSANGFFFVSAITKRPIGPRTIQRMCRLYFPAWIGRQVNPHALRHTFATRVLRTSNLRVVQQLLGHASITSTQLYTHPSNQEQLAAISSAF